MDHEQLERQHLETVNRLIAGSWARIRRQQGCVARLRRSGRNATVTEETLDAMWITLYTLRNTRKVIERELRRHAVEGAGAPPPSEERSTSPTQATSVLKSSPSRLPDPQA